MRDGREKCGGVGRRRETRVWLHLVVHLPGMDRDTSALQVVDDLVGKLTGHSAGEGGEERNLLVIIDGLVNGREAHRTA